MNYLFILFLLVALLFGLFYALRLIDDIRHTFHLIPDYSRAREL